ncbi:MAG TPA: hypothetical protein PKJ77_06235 [Thermodesulfobacteriota bacterium]|nr:hypothetical protein [Deltaproteobacteria bacterium]HNR14317.1 hypothetical protein [Thermodesulfobacteriota bacterium]HNU71931.1 hypothetical protein [Thermodesulfobacteriota bacterium]HOC38859.1 hypothetical protein [Thermodesulfobacteriota bacterium]
MRIPRRQSWSPAWAGIAIGMLQTIALFASRQRTGIFSALKKLSPRIRRAPSVGAQRGKLTAGNRLSPWIWTAVTTALIAAATKLFQGPRAKR